MALQYSARSAQSPGRLAGLSRKTARRLPLSGRAAFVLAALPIAAWALSGCGGGDADPRLALAPGGGTAVSLPGPYSTTATSGTSAFGAAYANRAYQSVVSLSGGQTGTLAVTTAASGKASGTFTIVDPSRAANPSWAANPSRSVAAKSRLVIATPFLSGTIDFATGAIHLSGSYSYNGQTIPISITGTLPTPPSYSGGSLTTVINGQAYTSTFGNTGGTINPTPSPSGTASPSPRPSTSPTPTPSPSGTPAPVGPVNTLTITAQPGTNANNRISTFVADARSIGVTAQGFLTNAPGGGGYLSVSAKTESANNSTGGASLSFDLTMPGTLATGTYPVQFGTGSTKPNVLFTYLEFDPTHSWQSYYNGQMVGEGSITVEQVDSTKVRVRLNGVRLEPGAGGFNGEKGTLRVSGVLETTSAPFLVN